MKTNGLLSNKLSLNQRQIQVVYNTSVSIEVLNLTGPEFIPLQTVHASKEFRQNLTPGKVIKDIYFGAPPSHMALH